MLKKHLPLRPSELHILVALAEKERHGYAIKQEVEARSGGSVRLGPGTLYETISRLEEKGLIREKKFKKGDRDHSQRRYYALTALGRRLLEAEVDRLGDIVSLARARLQESKS